MCYMFFINLRTETDGFIIFYASESNIQLPTQDELKTVLDKVKDFFGDAKESFGKLTTLNSSTTDELEEKSKKQAK